MSTSEYFCSLIINVIAFKSPLRRSSVITCFSRGRMTDDEISQRISMDFTYAVDR